MILEAVGRLARRTTGIEFIPVFAVPNACRTLPTQIENLPEKCNGYYFLIEPCRKSAEAPGIRPCERDDLAFNLLSKL